MAKGSLQMHLVRREHTPPSAPPRWTTDSKSHLNYEIYHKFGGQESYLSSRKATTCLCELWAEQRLLSGQSRPRRLRRERKKSHSSSGDHEHTSSSLPGPRSHFPASCPSPTSNYRRKGEALGHWCRSPLCSEQVSSGSLLIPR